MVGSRKPIRSLFVYGTLAPGQPNEHILKPLSGTWRRGTVTGFLHDRGWGAGQGYSGIELDHHGDDVHGQIFTSPGLDDFWQILDEFEGGEYQRALTTVRLPGGREIKAYIYELKKP